MTDRTAALAEALRLQFSRTCLPDNQAEFRAAAILAALPPDWCGHKDEIKNLYDRLADEGYKDGIRLAEAVNEVVLHQRGTIEEAWKYGDEQRALTIRQGREIIAADAQIARLSRIEEAARAVWDACEPSWSKAYRGEKIVPVVGQSSPSMAALRAALDPES